MSGGSFNYLSYKDIDDLWYGAGPEWDWMLDELDKLCPEAAVNMRKIKTDHDEFIKQNQSLWNDLQPVLHAVEWWRSNDWGKDQVDEAIQTYHERKTG